MLTLGIIAVQAMITLPVLKNAIPSKEETLHKKVSYQVEKVETDSCDESGNCRVEEFCPHEIARVSNSGEEGVYTSEFSLYAN